MRLIQSHVRVADDDKVYLVDGYLSLMFNNNPSMYRDKNICRFQEDQPLGLLFIYPADSSFVLTKTGNNWYVDDIRADSPSHIA